MGEANAPTLPELRESVLDRATLDALFADIGELTELLDVRVRSRARALSTDTRPNLASIHQMLTNGEIDGARLRYRHDGSVWSDTLVATGSGFRLIRMCET